MSSNTDRIERKTLLAAARARVWRALTDADEFGKWFGVKMDGVFARGARVTGQLTNPKYAHVTMELWIEEVEPERIFSYRWHPFAIDSTADYSNEKTTLVEFTLSDAEGGTLLTVVESGFDAVPGARRAKAFEMNSHGWEMQMKQIADYVGNAK